MPANRFQCILGHFFGSFVDRDRMDSPYFGMQPILGVFFGYVVVQRELDPTRSWPDNRDSVHMKTLIDRNIFYRVFDSLINRQVGACEKQRAFILMKLGAWLSQRSH